MNDWKHGYYADSGYTFGYYAETTPAQLAWASLLQGCQTPLTNFRYLDAGCGQGLNLILIAACHPDSEFIGIDFLPEHIAHANALAKACGLTNVKFFEVEFTELAEQPLSLGQFDYVVCHGITTWIAPKVRQKLFEVIGKALLPSGVFYNSYNTFPGWLTAVPFQHLVLLGQREQAGEAALSNGVALLTALQQAQAALFKQLPFLKDRLNSLGEQDPAYLVQEYNNQFWQPVFVTQMMDELSAVKLSFLGSATLPEIFDSSYASETRQLLKKYTRIDLREQVRDYAVNQSFRRDLYIKGKRKLWKFQHEDAIRNTRFTVNSMRRRPNADEHFVFKSGAIEIKGQHQVYTALLDIIQPHTDGVSVDQLLKHQGWNRNLPDTVTSLTYLLHGHWLSLVMPNYSGISARVSNTALARQVCEGAPYRFISLPSIGSAVNLKELEWFFLAAMLDDVPQVEWHIYAQALLKKHNRALQIEGTAITKKEKQASLLQDQVKLFGELRLPLLQQFSAI